MCHQVGSTNHDNDSCNNTTGGRSFPKWAEISMLIVIMILYAIALYAERKNKQEKNMRDY